MEITNEQKEQMANFWGSMITNEPQEFVVKEKYDELEKEIERLQDRIARANNFIDQVMLYRIPNKTKEVYEDIETLQNILNGSDKE